MSPVTTPYCQMPKFQTILFKKNPYVIIIFEQYILPNNVKTNKFPNMLLSPTDSSNPAEKHCGYFFQLEYLEVYIQAYIHKHSSSVFSIPWSHTAGMRSSSIIPSCARHRFPMRSELQQRKAIMQGIKGNPLSEKPGHKLKRSNKNNCGNYESARF